MGRLALNLEDNVGRAFVAVDRRAHRRLGHQQLIEFETAPTNPLGEDRRAATAGFFVRRGADDQIRLEDLAPVLHVFEQRQHHAEAGFGIDRAAPVNAPVFKPAVEWVADHRFDADGIDVDVDRDPAVGLPAPDAVGIRTARIDVLTLDFSPERLEPGRHLRCDSTFVNRAGAQPGVPRPDARNVNQAL